MSALWFSVPMALATVWLWWRAFKVEVRDA